MDKTTKLLNRLRNIGLLFCAVGVGLTRFTFIVDGGQKALMFDTITGRGVTEKVHGEGIHFKIPVFYTPIIFSVRLNPVVVETKTPARDLQLVDITVRILEKPDEDNLRQLYLDQRENYAKTILPNLTHETIKAVVSKYNPDQLITQRENVSFEIRTGLVNRAKEFNIIIHDVSIINFEFSKEYRNAIENKQVSQQMSERTKFLVMKAEEQKKITVIKAEAESESATIFNEAINQHGDAFLELKKIDTSVSIMRNVMNNGNVTFMPNKGNVFYKI